MIWNVVAPFFGHPSDRWIDDYVQSEIIAFRKIPFHKSPSTNWHTRLQRPSSITDWFSYWQTSQKALTGSQGLVTVFPQLAGTAAASQFFAGKRKLPIVAWCFNIGRFELGLKQAVAARVMRNISRFVVHSRGEIDIASNYLGLDRDRFEFVPLQCAKIEKIRDEEQGSPFIVSIGSANRDYKTLLEAARLSRLPLQIVAAPRSLVGLKLPQRVSVQSGLSHSECRSLTQRARFSVIPLDDVDAASGQITVIESQIMGKPVIATRTVGTIDYITDGETGVLVDPKDPNLLADRMESLWEDSERRSILANRAFEVVNRESSDEAAASHLLRIVQSIS